MAEPSWQTGKRAKHMSMAIPAAMMGGSAAYNALKVSGHDPSTDSFFGGPDSPPPRYGGWGNRVNAYGEPDPHGAIMQPGQQGADSMAGIGMAHMGPADAGQGYAMGEMSRDRGAMAVENQDLSNREAESRYGDQNGALQLARESAMGQSPSQAAYLMQQGLNQGIASQSAMAGGARGGAAMALAQGNAQANVANLQNQTYTQAGALRANEMAQGRGLYGTLAQGQREQDLQRLGQGNQMSQFNAGLNDQYRMGMGNLANQFGSQSQGWYGQSQRPYESQLAADSGSQNAANSRYGIQAQQGEWNAGRNERNTNAAIGAAGGVLQAGVDYATKQPTGGGGMGGSKQGTGYWGGIDHNNPY